MRPTTVASPTWAGLALAALPLAVGLTLFAVGRLGQVRATVVATVRMVMQLLLLGLVLEGVFANARPWLIAAVVAGMLVASAFAASGRQRRPDRLARLEALAALALAGAVALAVGLGLALRPSAWADPRTVIPLAGMVLSHAVQSVALAAERLDATLAADRDLVELRLALGADPATAARPALRDAARAAIAPLVNSLSLAGIVAIPGMMTGQLLSGSTVFDALRYQIFIFLLIGGSGTLGTLAMLRLRLRRRFTAAWQLRSEGG